MPKRPKRPIRRRAETGLTPDELECFIAGWCLDPQPDFARYGGREAAWRQYREEILSLQGQKVIGAFFFLGPVYFNYFERPRAWHEYDAPEKRRIVGYKEGLGRFRIPVYEPERVYLDRIGALNEKEQELLAKEGK